MKYLFVHQNFPGQFKHLAPALAAGGHEVTALSMTAKERLRWNGVDVLPYRPLRSSTPGVHPWVTDFEAKVIRAEASFRMALALKEGGLQPDAIIAHPGWGETLFLKDVWPRARMGLYCEYYYHLRGGDVGFDPEFPESDPGEVCRLRLKNLNNDLHFPLADAAISPTHWQASTFPEPFRSKITVIHDGIDTQALVPNPAASMTLNQSTVLTRADEVITFVNRNLEPTRGYHVFMRALPRILKERPQARVIIVGGAGVSYGKAAEGKSWKDIYLDEVRERIDTSRVHFVGHLSYPNFVALLQLSTVHVYLTYPFVLSWSLLEAMSAGCAIVASDTTPLHEAIQDGETGRLVGFFDVDALADTVGELLRDKAQRERLGAQARAATIERYDLRTVCLPRQVEWAGRLAN